MQRQWIAVVGLVSMTGAATLGACSSSSGSAGPAGANGDAGAPGTPGNNGMAGDQGTPGTPGMNGMNGAPGMNGAAGEAGATIILSETAKHGLDISPVPVNLAGLTGDQIEQVGQGSYLVNAIGDCTGCHTADPTKFLAGGTQFGGGGAPFTVTSRNLTPDPTTGLPSDIQTLAQFLNVLQTGADYHGVATGGTPVETLVVMPWADLRWMSVADQTAIYAYLTTIPAVSNMIAADTKMTPAPAAAAPTSYTDGDQATGTPLPPAAAPDPGNTLRGLALNPLTEVKPPTDPSSQALFGRGAYLVNALAACNDCHTNPTTTSPASTKINTAVYLTGGMEFDTPPPLQPVLGTVRAVSANLLGKDNGFFNNPDVTFATFLTLITQGIHAEDPMPAPVAFPMPWQTFSNMELGDLEAIYTYMNAVATQYGTKSLTGTADKVIPDPALYCDSSHACTEGTCSSGTAAGECLNHPCAAGTVNEDCNACQTCSASTCQAPVAGPPCAY